MQFYKRNDGTDEVDLFIPRDITSVIMQFINRPKANFRKCLKDIHAIRRTSPTAPERLVAMTDYGQYQSSFCSQCGNYMICDAWRYAPPIAMCSCIAPLDADVDDIGIHWDDFFYMIEREHENGYMIDDDADLFWM